MPPKILIVDDEAHIRTLLQRTFMDLEDDFDVELLTAENGEEALIIVEQEKPELVFLDVMMPKMNGYDTCYTIKKKLKLEDITVVLLTAKGQTVDRKYGFDVGADHYVTKPFDPDDLLEMAMDILGLEND